MATIDDIAKKTGFSKTTISKALNDKADISEKTKRIVRQAAWEMNYIPNINAKNLRVKKNNVIALIISSPSEESEKTNTLYPLLMGVNKHLALNGLELALYIIDSESQTRKSYVDYCKERNVLGAILVGIRTDDPYLDELKHSLIPYVLIDVDISGTEHMNVIKIDDVQAAYEATAHLIEAGHEHVAFVNGLKKSTVAIDRMKGYKQALADYGLPYREEYVVHADFSEDKAKERSLDLLSEHPRISAVFCASDLMALGVMEAAYMLGMDVPDDLSLVGFDDIPIAEYLSPPLTTVNQNFHDKGKAAAELISSQLIRSDEKEIVTLPHRLVKRRSVKILP